MACDIRPNASADARPAPLQAEERIPSPAPDRAPAPPPVPGEPAALAVRGLTFRYGSRIALDSASLTVARGTVCGLLGPNGSGKTTLFRCCMNFLNVREGSILMDGTESTGLSPAQLARRVSYVPQEHRQAFPFPVRDVVRMGRTPHMRGFFRLGAEDDRRAEDAMERVGIAHLADQPCHRLSGGQRQLVLIARAVAQAAPLMLLDEPTSALDFQNQLVVWKTLRHVASMGVTVVVCCHDPNHILWFCDQAVLMTNGRVLASGEPGRVMAEGGLTAMYGDACAQGVVDGLPIVHPRFSAR